MKVNSILARIGSGKPVAADIVADALTRAVDPGKIAVLAGYLARVDVVEPATTVVIATPEPVPSTEPESVNPVAVGTGLRRLAEAMSDERIAALAEAEGKGFMRTKLSKRGLEIRNETLAGVIEAFGHEVASV
jgi:hypothetical protein